MAQSERSAQSERELLGERLGRYPAERYPVQHAATQFHLGSALLLAGDFIPAAGALRAARDMFEQAGMRLEKAKANVMLGAALRADGRRDQAVAAFSAACADLAQLDQPAEQAAASYNLGLVLQDSGERGGARAAWASAYTLFLTAGYPGQASAAAREHGVSLLTTGDVTAAVGLLQNAVALAERAGDEPAMGSAANTLGLAHLAAQAPAPALVALRAALGAFPRSTRPADHAMVKANLALAHEQAGAPARARLAARQALAVPGAAAPVRAQATQLLARLSGSPDQDLFTVLDAEPREQWVPVLREELLRAAELTAGQRCTAVGGFLDGVLARPGASRDLAESLLQVVLELPPRTYQLFVSALVDACAGRPDADAERLRTVISSALARFAVPQWQRLAASLNAAAQVAGAPATWT